MVSFDMSWWVLRVFVVGTSFIKLIDVLRTYPVIRQHSVRLVLAPSSFDKEIVVVLS